jgi:undecaprenyl pyrophosphate synthase
LDMLALNVFVRVKHGGREELLEAVRVLFDELAKEPTFLDRGFKPPWRSPI